MQLSTWRRLAARALLPGAAALAAAGCNPRAGDPDLPSTGGTPDTTRGTASGIAPPGATTGSGIRVSDLLTPTVPAKLANPVSRPAP